MGGAGTERSPSLADSGFEKKEEGDGFLTEEKHRSSPYEGGLDRKGLSGISWPICLEEAPLIVKNR